MYLKNKESSLDEWKKSKFSRGMKCMTYASENI